MGGDCSQKLLLRRGMPSSPGRSRSSDQYSIAKIGCPRPRLSGFLFFPASRGSAVCAFFPLKTPCNPASVRSPLLSFGGVVPARPPKWLPPPPPLTTVAKPVARRWHLGPHRGWL